MCGENTKIPLQHYPYALRIALMTGEYGLPWASWFDAPAGVVYQMSTCKSYYDAHRSMSKADDYQQWKENNPTYAKLVEAVLELKIKRGEFGG